jgi:hypothetical protein
MDISQLFSKLDWEILRNLGDLESTLKTPQGKLLIQQLLAEENRSSLRQWYDTQVPMNSLAMEIKAILERELGGELKPGAKMDQGEEQRKVGTGKSQTKIVVSK